MRRIFDRFAKTGSALTIARELNAAGEVTKRRQCADGARGGKQWTKGAVYKVLANRVYLGEAVHKGMAYPGEHAAIIDQRTWDKAHAVMAEPSHRRGAATRAQMPALLKGLIFGPNGRAMSPSHTRRRGRIYRYYVTREAIADGYDTCAGDQRARRRRRRRCAGPKSRSYWPRQSWSREPGRPRSARARTRSPSVRSRSCSPSSPRSGMSCSPPSRRGSSSCSSSRSTCRRTRSRCGSGPRVSRAWSAELRQQGERKAA